MTTTEPELIELLKKLRYDLTDMQVKVGEALRMASNLELPDQTNHTCAVCKIECRSVTKLAEHIYYQHDGPIPNHMLAAEALALEPAGASE